MRSILFLAAVTSLVAAAPSVADACSPPPCWPSFFTPGNGTTVPANLPAIHWRPGSGFGTGPSDPSKVVLVNAAAPNRALPFTATKLPDGAYAIVPDRPLTAGSTYVITDQTICGTMPMTSMFQVTAAAPLPTELGALAETENLIGPLQLASSGGACSAEVDAHRIGIELQLVAAASAWRDVLHFETLVDGQVWTASRSAPSVVPPGASWSGRGIDLLYRVCKTADDSVSEGLATGAHEVVLRATLPGSTTVVESSPLAVDIECTGDVVPDPDGDKDGDGGCDAGGSGSSSWLLLGALAALVGLRRRTARSSG